MIMATNTEKSGVINFCSFQVLEDLHYADDLALLSANGKQLQFKTNELIRVSAELRYRGYQEYQEVKGSECWNDYSASDLHQ